MLFQQNRYKEAEVILKGLLAEQPNNPHVLYVLAQIALKFNDLKVAISLLEICTPLMLEHPEPLLQLANLYQEGHQLDDADRSFQMLLKRFPNLCKGHFMYAGFLKSIGCIDQSISQLQFTLKLDPKHSAAMLALSDMLVMKKGDKLYSQMEQLLDELMINKSSNSIAQMHLHYGLGKGADDQKEYQQAFDHWTKANTIQLSQCHFRISQMQTFYKQLKLSFDNEIKGLVDTDF